MLAPMRRLSAHAPHLHQAALHHCALLPKSSARWMSTSRSMGALASAAVVQDASAMRWRFPAASPAVLRATCGPASVLPVGNAIAMHALARSPMQRSSSLWSPVVVHQVRLYSRRCRHEWDSEHCGHGRKGCSGLRKGAMIALGVGAVIALSSCGFGVIVFGAAGYGFYTLYRRFFAPYRAPRNAEDSFRDVDENIERLFRDGKRDRRGADDDRVVSKDLQSLMEGMPFLVRGAVKTIFSFVGRELQGSMERAGELRRLAGEYVRTHPRVVAQLGDDVLLSTPHNWTEYTVNGVGRVAAAFAVEGPGYTEAQVAVKATIGSDGHLTLKEIKYRNFRTGEKIDLLHDAPTGPKKTTVDADFKET